MNRPPLYILAGGHSRRFGRDKALAELEGRPLIRRIADGLAPVTCSIAVVAQKTDQYAALGLKTIGDLQPDLGPLGGLLTALRHLEETCEGDWLLLCACDLTQAQPHWVNTLMSHVTREAEIVAFRSSTRWEPLLALYHRCTIDRVVRHIESNRLAMQALLDQAATVSMDLPADWPAVSQINTPEDHARAKDNPFKG